MVLINDCRQWALDAGEPLEFRTLRVVPLFAPSRDVPAYRLLGPDTAGDVEVAEVSESGSVPDIRVVNRLEDRLLLIDGQELVGAKQNRILNTDVLVPAKSDVVIPVSCVEAGRWAYAARGFRSGSFAYRSARAAKSSDIYDSLKAEAGHRSDQQGVWDDVHKLMDAVNASSPTSAMADVYRHKDRELGEIREAFTLPQDAVGIAVFHGDRLLGLDVFDRASTLAHHWKALVDSYALDWLAFGAEPEEADPADAVSVGALLQTLAGAEWETFDTPGEGTDLRLETGELTASALIWAESEQRTILHLQVFPRRPMTDRRPRRRVRPIAQGIEQSIDRLQQEVADIRRRLRNQK